MNYLDQFPAGWDTVENCDFDDLGDLAWHRGFFALDPEHRTWRRNFQEMRLRDIALFSIGDLSGKSILDVGCGEGLYAFTFAQLGAKFVAGQDLSPSSISRGLNLAKRRGISLDLVVGDCNKLQFSDNTFDAVFSGDFFEHISHATKALVLAEIWRVLKPGGTLTIKTPNLAYLKLSCNLKRLATMLSFGDPRGIHIAHTHNNPDNEHHGLISIAHLKQIVKNCMFHEPKIVKFPLYRRRIPKCVAEWLCDFPIFNETIIMTMRKPIFLSLY